MQAEPTAEQQKPCKDSEQKRPTGCGTTSYYDSLNMQPTTTLAYSCTASFVLSTGRIDIDKSELKNLYPSLLGCIFRWKCLEKFADHGLAMFIFCYSSPIY